MSNILEELQPANGSNVPVTVGDALSLELLNDLPGNILIPHRRDFVRLYFVDHPDRDSSVAWLRSVGARITTASVQAGQINMAHDVDRVFVGLYLTRHGLERAGIPRATFPADAAFDDRPGSVAARCGDGTIADPLADWERPFRNHTEPIGALLLLAFDEEEREAADNLQKNWVDIPVQDRPTRMWVRAQENGGRLLNSTGQDVEHFGFVDGVAKMTFLQSAPSIPPQAGWSDFFPLKQVLRTLPVNPRSCGSFLVFRKLEQDVSGFQQAIADLAPRLFGNADSSSLELTAAHIVGRFRDGTPLTLQSSPGLGPRDDFNYEASTTESRDAGQRCPFHAHIRKMNPRGDHDLNTGNAPNDDSAAPTPRDRLPVRRSIPYGGRNPGEPRGLLFMAFVRSIGENFEHLMQRWANAGAFPHTSANLDPLLGRQPGKTTIGVRVPDPAGDGLRTTHPFTSCVTARGGVYLFAPPRSFFTEL